MKMKKYTAATIAEAMKQIRNDLGEDAVILNSKVVTSKKFFGLFQKKHFEVVAGVDRFEAKMTPPPFVPKKEPVISAPMPSVAPITSFVADVNKPVQSSSTPGISDELKKEIADLKSIMQSMKKQSVSDQYSTEIVRLIEFLRKQELDEQLIDEISEQVYEMNQREEVTYEQALKHSKHYLQSKLSGLQINGLSYDKKFVHVLGPTGVGKTTTIAKMAARAVLEQKKKIGFITTDTYRIAAIEQLKTYAGLLQAPIEIVYNADDYNAALQKLAHLDLIFIDTAGRNYKEQKYVTDLQNLVRFDEASESFLVLSLTSKQRDLEVIIEQFANIPIDKFIFTKVDETNSVGTMFNLMIKYNKGLAYYTDGQEVPEDIEQASIESLLQLFYQGELI